MQIIVTHTNSDFDALASLVAARKLYPAARIVIPGSPEEAVADFIVKYEKELNLLAEKEVKLEEVSLLVMVDTRHSSRLGRLGEITQRKNLEIHIYDHHAVHPQDFKGKINVGRLTGATVTILLEMIRKKDIPLSAFEASLMLLGLYQDTGSLTYPSTTEEDKEAARYLLSCGADLNFISGYLKKKMTGDQIVLYRQLKKTREVFFFGGAKIIILSAVVNHYIPNLALITQKFLDEEKADVVFTLVVMTRHLHLVARSRSKEIDVEEIVSFFGGGGHSTAAYARIKEGELKAVKKNILAILRRKIKKLGREDWNKVIPVPEISPAPAALKKGKNLKGLMDDRLPVKIIKFLKRIGGLGDKEKKSVFVVGGFVRDLILGVPNYDIDIVVEGDGISFADKLAQGLKAKVRKHKKFGTAVIYLSDGFKIDVATARTEYYHYPAALPQVTGSSIEADLYRRDFTINALAICLNKDRFGRLIDFFGGERDLKKGIIRALHDLSFVEDPTRIFRAVRFEQRYGFRIDRPTRHLIRTAVNLEMFDWLTNQRLLEELILILSEKEPVKAIKRMSEFNELRFIHPRIELTRDLKQLFKSLKVAIEWVRKKLPHEKINSWLIYFLALLDNLDKNETQQVINKFIFSRRNGNLILLSKEKGPQLSNNLRTKGLKNSEIFCQLMGLPLEVLVYLLAKAGSSREEERIKKFISELRKIHPLIQGKDLAGLGIKEGPVYKEIFRNILWNKLDGKIKTKKDEIVFVRERWAKPI